MGSYELREQLHSGLAFLDFSLLVLGQALGVAQ